MARNLIFWPVLVQILLTLVMFVRLAQAKGAAMRTAKVDETRRALHADAWPDAVIAINNNIRNQSEVPVLFYVLAGILWALDAVGPLVLGLAWLFALSRIVHAFIHTGANVVPIRRRVFTVGVVAVMLMLGQAAATLLGY